LDAISCAGRRKPAMYIATEKHEKKTNGRRRNRIEKKRACGEKISTILPSDTGVGRQNNQRSKKAVSGEQRRMRRAGHDIEQDQRNHSKNGKRPL